MRIHDQVRIQLPTFLTPTLVLALLLGAESAIGCSCKGLPRAADDLFQLVEQSDVVFLGQLDEVHIRYWAVGGEQKKEIYISYLVIEWLKGQDRKAEIEIEFEMEKVGCGPSPRPKNTYLVFASNIEGGHRARAKPCRINLYEHGDPEDASENFALREALDPILEIIRNGSR